MLFNSFEFAVFLPVVFAIYWGVLRQNLKLQNAFLLIASYIFYGWWDWRFLSLIIFSSSVDFLVGLGLEKSEQPGIRKLLLSASVFVNIGFLAIFKYYDFFAENFAAAFTLFGQPFAVSSLNIILPVGISFYTFQTLSYTIDVYRSKLKPTKDPVAFFAFVAFFPQLVAGPIERATNLLPQFLSKRNFDYQKATDGLRQILWGLFKKMVIADNCAFYVNQIYANSDFQTGSTLLFGTFLFAVQIYADFSGYSDIAIGTARLFGFDLMRNFAFPYFSRDIAEFWRRWHISLTTWFRDYVYIPLGGSRVRMSRIIRNIFIVFIVSGFWHGANWTFIFWGLLNAIYFLPLLLLKRNRTNLDTVSKGRLIPTFREFVSILLTFVLTLGAWVFFRSETIAQGFSIYAEIFSGSLFSFPGEFSTSLIIFIIGLFSVEWVQREKEHGLDFENRNIPNVVRYLIYYAIVALIFLFAGNPEEFIYFQF